MQPSDIYKLLPQYNCSECGFLFCSTFSRRIAHLKNNAEECIFLSKENLNKIKELLKQEIEVDRIKKDTAFIRPCTEEGFLTAETNLCSYSNFGNGFDEKLFCLILENSDVEKCDCSSELGYSILFKETKRIHIFRNGNIIIRKAKDNDDIYTTLNFISFILLPAVITDCYCSFIECYLKNCNCCKIDFEKDETRYDEFEEIIEILKNKNNLEKANEILGAILKKSIKLIANKKYSGLILFSLFLSFKTVLMEVEKFESNELINFFFDAFYSLRNLNKNKSELENRYKELRIKFKDNWKLLKILNYIYLILKII